MNLYYCIVIFPSSPVQEKANTYRKRYDSQYAFIPPHIKLLNPVQLSPDQLEHMISTIRRLAGKTKPFTLRFHKVGSFSPTNNVIYYGIENKNQLTDLHRELMDHVRGSFDPYVYVPHLTIAQDLTYEEMNDVFGRLKMVNVDMSSDVQQIHLLQRPDTDAVWEIVQSFQLGGKESE